MKPKEKVVSTDYFEVDVFTDHEIGSVKNVASGEVATVQWKKLEKTNTYGWYVKVAIPIKERLCLISGSLP